MNVTQIINAVRAGLSSSDSVGIDYTPRTTDTNGEYIEVQIGSEKLSDRFQLYSIGRVMKETISHIIEPLKAEFPHLHIIERKKEFHFYFPGFNSCATWVVPVSISNLPTQKEIVKTGKVTEKYTLVGKRKVMELMDAHPDYELYKRSGFGFRGAQEGRCTREDMIKMLDWMACADVEVIDNEIHVNGFSDCDMW